MYITFTLTLNMLSGSGGVGEVYEYEGRGMPVGYIQWQLCEW